MRMSCAGRVFFVMGLMAGWVIPGYASAALDETCVINVLNRTVQVGKGGVWSLPNVPSNMGNVRARTTCIQNGQTVSGQSDYFSIIRDERTVVGEIKFEAQEPVPVSVAFTEPGTTTLTTVGATYQVGVKATYANGSIKTVTAASTGINYSSTNPAIATVTADGLVTAKTSGTVLINARKDEVIAIKRIVINSTGDVDADGLPDDFELANGLNPNDAIDAQEDQDTDGLTALQEYQLGTDINKADTDGDGISDGEETIAGIDGFITNPLNRDTDGDGMNDRLEVLAGSSPIDAKDANFAAALQRIAVTPANVVLTFNTISSEASTQLAVTGYLLDGTTANLTARTTGTSYTSGNISIVSFGLTDGEIFAGQSGTTTVTVTNNGKQAIATIKVESFAPVALSAINIPGYANNVDVSGNYAYVAAGAAGLQVVDVSDRKNPKIVSSLDTDGTAIDIRVFGKYAYIADGSAGLKIISIADPLVPVLVGSIDTAGIAQDVKIDSQYAYVADGVSGLEIIDVRNPSQPISKSKLNGLGDAMGVDVEGNRAVVVGGSTLYVIDITDKAGPVKVGSINIGPLKDVVMNGNYAYVAAYSTGYKVIDISNPSALRITGGDGSIAPRDVELTDGFAFFAEQLFPNVVAYVNVQNPEKPVFQGTIDLSAFGDYAGTGIALDGSYAYITEESFAVWTDYQETGTTKLFIAQYRMINDNGGVRPTVTITKPVNGSVVVEGATVTLNVDAQDDIGVAAVNIAVNGQVVFTDTTRPYQVPVTIPYGATTVTIAAVAVDFGNNSTATQVVLTVQPDADRDGLGDTEESTVYLTNPNNADTDADGLKDGEEVSLGTNPLVGDTDGDGLSDKQEVDQATDPLNPDVTRPQVSKVDPANAEQGVPETKAIIVTFNEPLQPKSVQASSVGVYNSVTAAAVPGSVRLMSNGQDVIFTPSGLLGDYTDYRIIVQGLRDVAGNPMAANFESVFKTGNVVDTAPPQVVDTNPPNGAVGVPVNTAVNVYMDEPIDPASVTDNVFFVYDTLTGAHLVGVSSLSSDGRTLTFVPNAGLAVGRLYYVYIYGVKDLFGNISYSTRSFTTSFAADVTGPVVLKTSLADGLTAVPTNVVLAVQFDEPVNSLKLGQVMLSVGGQPVSATRQVSADHRTVTLKLFQPLTANTAYVLTIDGIEDLSGNALASAQAISFTSGAGADLLAPSVVTRTPFSGATNVPLNTVVLVEFSERLNPLTVTGTTGAASVVLYDPQTGQIYSSTLGLSADGRTLSITPTALLAPNHQYSVYLYWNTNTEDLAGNRHSSSFSFRTVP